MAVTSGVASSRSSLRNESGIPSLSSSWMVGPSLVDEADFLAFFGFSLIIRGKCLLTPKPLIRAVGWTIVIKNWMSCKSQIFLCFHSWLTLISLTLFTICCCFLCFCRSNTSSLHKTEFSCFMAVSWESTEAWRFRNCLKSVRTLDKSWVSIMDLPEPLLGMIFEPVTCYTNQVCRLIQTLVTWTVLEHFIFADIKKKKLVQFKFLFYSTFCLV